VLTAREMFEAVMAEAGRCDAFISVAAVADWRADHVSPVKMKKDDGAPALRLTRNPDILSQVGHLPSPPFCVGFAAETDRIIEHARAKLATKRASMIVANRAQDVLGSDLAQLIVVDAQGELTWPRATKLEQARRLIAEIAARLPKAQ
jgi:phosphopantothenoylcysteine decarboxylase / phosphopantothenate---cysteine ligase